jgi:Zn-dependent protease
MLDTHGSASAEFCAGCGSEVPTSFKACPSCHRLVHGDELKRLAQKAEQSTRDGDLSAAMAAWRSAVELLPPDSRQYETIQGKITALGRQADQSRFDRSSEIPVEDPDAPGPKWTQGAGAAGVGTLALAVWKFKFLVILALSKAKLLVLGLTKASTFFSMILSMGVYATAWGWKFAVGLVVSIYIHEMGHVSALLRYGVKATAPLFIPALGAVVRLKQVLDDPRQEARVALAGPLWGLGAALVCYVIFLATQLAYWGALARTGAVLNLFNLLPLWQLDGGRAFHSLTRSQRWFVTTVIATMWAITSEGFTFLIMLVAAYQAAVGRPAREPDRFASLVYAALIVALSAMTMIPVVLPG